jgi:hypothetical protein
MRAVLVMLHGTWSVPLFGLRGGAAEPSPLAANEPFDRDLPLT